MRTAGKLTAYNASFLSTGTEESKKYFFITICFLTTTPVCSYITILYGYSLWVQKFTNPNRTRISSFCQKKSEQAYHKLEGTFKFMTVSTVQRYNRRGIQKYEYLQMGWKSLGQFCLPPLPLPRSSQSANWQGNFSEITWYSGTYSNLHFDVIALTARLICFRQSKQETTNSGGMRFFPEG
jgi:hypothetical protein